MARVGSQALKVGMFVVTVVAVLLGSLALMGALNFWRPVASYYVLTDESVAGLDVNSAVTLRGVAVGKIVAIELDRDNFARVEIELEIDPSVAIPLGSAAYFERVGLTGERAINISGGELADGRLPPGSVIPHGQTALDRLQDQAVAFSGELSTLVANITETVEDIDALVTAIDAEHVGEIIEAVEPARVSSIVAHAERATSNLAATSVRLDRTVGELRSDIRQITDNVDTVAGKAGVALERADTAMQALSGTIADVDQVVQANRDDLRAAVQSLRRTSQAAEALVEKVREQPSLLLRKQRERPRRRGILRRRDRDRD